MRFRKIYLEISNICNLNCAFCPKTKRAPRRMSASEFSSIAGKLRPYSDFIYFHVMGEPLCHPDLEKLLDVAGAEGFKVIITTNGTLLGKRGDVLLSHPAVHKVNLSLHAFEANDIPMSFDDYIGSCLEFAKSAEGKRIVVLRLWNEGGENELNEKIIDKIKRKFADWVCEKHGIRIGDRIYLENGDKFEWPDLAAVDEGDNLFCYGLCDQIGILADGTVVPCCLDHEGDIALGNIFETDMEEILASERATAIYEGFKNHRATEELCRKCGYARRFK